MPKFFIKTYGCQMNERDSEQVAHSLIERGYARAETSTMPSGSSQHCSVGTWPIRKRSARWACSDAWQERPHVVFGFSGAWRRPAATHCSTVAASRSGRGHPKIPPSGGLRGERKRARFVAQVGPPPYGRSAFLDLSTSAKKRARRKRFVNSSWTETSHGIRLDHAGMQHALHFLHCPQTRGARTKSFHWIDRARSARSRRPRSEGSNLLGQIVNRAPRFRGSWGDDPGSQKSPFVQLLEAVHEIDGLRRLRFTSPHPIGFRDDLIGSAWSDLPKLAEHVHLPLQSGSNKILKAMHRALHGRKIFQSRTAHPAGSPGRDHHRYHVGFPGETESDYQQTRDLASHIQFDNAFMFRYSPRRGTPAAEMTNQVENR